MVLIMDESSVSPAAQPYLQGQPDSQAKPVSDVQPDVISKAVELARFKSEIVGLQYYKCNVS